MKDSFNADFYVTIATVVPVLLVAVNVSSYKQSMFADMVRSLAKSTGSSRIVRAFAAVFVIVTPFFLGVWAELRTLYALLDRENLSLTQAKLLVIAVFLLLVAAISGVLITIGDEMTDGEGGEGKDKKSNHARV
jgi:hypothetical protein